MNNHGLKRAAEAELEDEAGDEDEDEDRPRRRHRFEPETPPKFTRRDTVPSPPPASQTRVRVAHAPSSTTTKTERRGPATTMSGDDTFRRVWTRQGSASTAPLAGTAVAAAPSTQSTPSLPSAAAPSAATTAAGGSGATPSTRPFAAAPSFPHAPLHQTGKMVHPFMAFDLEMSALLPSVWPTDGFSPVRVLCAATASMMDDGCGGSGGAEPFVQLCFNTTDPRLWLTPYQLCGLVDTLWAAYASGVTLVTWGGTASDWRVLASECALVSPLHAWQCRTMACNAVDVPFAAVSSMGGMMGLRAAALGMGFDSKDADASASIPALWTRGQQQVVFDHVMHDAATTARVYRAMFQSRRGPPTLQWVTQRGTVASWYAPCRTQSVFPPTVRLPTVIECMHLPRAHPKFVPRDGLCRDGIAAWLFSE